jgi:hypothetical protein
MVVALRLKQEVMMKGRLDPRRRRWNRPTQPSAGRNVRGAVCFLMPNILGCKSQSPGTAPITLSRSSGTDMGGGEAMGPFPALCSPCAESCWSVLQFGFFEHMRLRVVVFNRHGTPAALEIFKPPSSVGSVVLPLPWRVPVA